MGRQLKDAAPKLQHGHGAGHGILDAVLAGAASLVGEDSAQKELQHAAEQVGVADDEEADVVGQREGPLSVGGHGEHVVHQVGRDVGHPARLATWAK